jgi:hypothetical protein
MKILEVLQGKKIYVLMAVGAIVSFTQYAFHFNLHIPELPEAKNVGELIQQVYTFALGAAARSAVAK